MFKPTRKRVVKAKEKATFKLEFHVTHVPQQRWDKLQLSLVSLDTGKAISKTGKSPVKNGTCHWAEALSESIFISQDSNGKDALKESYKLVVSTGLSRFGILGDATINLMDYLQSTTPVSLSLPLQNCNSGSILHVKVQRLLPKSASRDPDDQNEALQQSSTALTSEGDHSAEVGEENSPQLDRGDSVYVPSTPLVEEPRLHGREDDEFMSLTSSASSSGRHEAEGGVYDGEFMSPETLFKPLGPSSSSYGSPQHQNSSPDRQNVEGDSPVASSTRVGHDEKRWETSQSQRRTRLQRTASVAMPSSWEHDTNQVAVAEIEALRQQLSSEARRSEEVHTKLSMLIAERDNIKQEMESLKLMESSPQPNTRDGGSKWQQQMEEESRQAVKELQDELDYVKGINLNLSVQLEKTQESNLELLLEIQDLEKEPEKQRSETEHESPRVEDNESDLVESLRKELAELERDSQELTVENLDLLSQLKQANDTLKERDDTIISLEADKAHINNSDGVATRGVDIAEDELKEKLRKSEEARLAIEAESQIFLNRAAKAENDHLNAVEMIKNLQAACQMLEQEKGENIERLKKQLEETHEQLSTMSKLYKDDVQVMEGMKAERLELEAEIAAVVKAKEEERDGVCQLQAMNTMLEEKLCQEELNASKLMRQCEAAEADSLWLQQELDASKAQVQIMQQSMCELERSHSVLSNELNDVLQKDRLNLSQIKDLEFRVAILEDEANSLRASKALLEAEMQEMKSPKDVNWSKQSKAGVEENFSHFQDPNVKGLRRPLEERNTEANDHLQMQSSDLSWKLSEKEIELQDLKTRVFYLEEELQRKSNALASAEKRLKEQRDSAAHEASNQVSYLTRSLSRANSRVGANKPTIPPSREAKELSDLRSKVKLLEGEVKKKAAELEASKEQLKEQYTNLSSRIERMELANEELVKEHSNSKLEQALKELSSMQNQNALLFQRENELLFKLASQEALQCELETLKEEKKELESALLKFNAAAKGENILKRISTLETELAEVLESNVMYKTQLQSVFAKQQNVHAAALENLGSVDKVVKDLAELKRKNMNLEEELCDMKERYFNMSLQFAEVEAEREELVMTIRNLRGTKKFVPLRSAIF